MNAFERQNAVLTVEFDRYVREHPTFAARIPRGAQVVLQVPGDAKFNAWAGRIAERQRAPGQAVVFVKVRRLRPARSRLVGPKIEIRAA